MLVVRRKIGEVIAIGQDIEVEVIEISKTRVKLGIRAPREIEVNRAEAAHLALENQRASSLISMHGASGVSDLAGLIRKISSEAG